MQLNSSKTVIASGIAAMGIIFMCILIIWKNNVDTDTARLHKLDDFHKAAVFIDQMRLIALQRTILLQNMQNETDPFVIDEINYEFVIRGSRFMAARDKLLSVELSPEVMAIWEITKAGITTTGLAQLKTANLLLDNQRQEANKILYKEVIPSQNRVQQLLSDLLKAQTTASEIAIAMASKSKSNTYKTIFVVGLFALIFTVGIIKFIVNMTSRIQRDLLVANEATLANQMKSDFLAKMSHEIRTPLGVIIGYAETALDSNQTMEERITGTNRIIHNGNHLLGIINDILDLSKVESGKLSIEHIPVSTINLINDVCNLTKLKADEKHLVCDVNYTFPLPKEIITDPVRLKQVLINLVGNAIKFTEKGHVYLKVEFSKFDNKIRFIIEDTGIGIPEDQHEKIFTAFSQADATTTRKYGGTGLGLNLSKDLVEKMGGELTLESMPDTGSIFTVTIDIGSPEDKSLIYNLNQTTKNDTVDSQTKTEKKTLHGDILLVEDNEDNQLLLSRIIKKCGAKVTIAENGLEAIKILKNKSFDLIFMDMQMPIMDGLTATKELRSTGCKIPIIALTANAFKEDRDKCFSAGCNDFLTKPVSTNSLYAALELHLNTV